ncbi:MAG: polymer-forming cytoskeletal protein [Patescibacteria group bacterium]|jgi:cytoskeletal protein CcmA (bactofilin family)|nr:polymer-forming cytoskeletal protein [Patescibacteria group bacterium]
MKRFYLLFLFVLALFFSALPQGAQAEKIINNESLYLAPEETITGNVYATSKDITIEGEIEGDLIAMAEKINIKGHLDGDLIAIAEDIIIDGEINGNVRIMGKTLTINGIIARNLNFIGQSLFLEKDSQVFWDISAISQNIEIKGYVLKNAHLWYETLNLEGNIAGNLKIKGDKNSTFNLSPNANINGDFYHQGFLNQQTINTSSIKGLIYKTEANNYRESSWPTWWQILIYQIIAIFIIAVILLKINKNLFFNTQKQLQKKPLVALGWGLLIIALTPLLIILSALSFIGLPLAIIIFSIWLIIISLGPIFVAFLLGIEIVKKLKIKTKHPNICSLLLGIVIIACFNMIPVIGIILLFLSSALGSGALLLNLKK